MEALCLTAVGGYLFGFPKSIIELLAPFLPSLITDNLKENKMCKPETVEEPEPKTKMRIKTDENYISCEWAEKEVPSRAMQLIHENIEDEENYEKITNTCVKLIELFAMYGSRREELSRIRDRIMRVDSELAERIDLSRFSQCSFYEGRILLYR
jgi:hypothetical protein